MELQLLLNELLTAKQQFPPKFENFSYSIVDASSIEKSAKSMDLILQFWAEYNTETMTRYKLVERLRNSNSRIVLASDEQADTVGFGVFSFNLLPLTNKLRIEMHALFVRHDKRLRNIARNIIMEIVKFGENIGCKFIYAQYGVEQFYEKIGFKKTERTLGFEFVQKI